MRVPMPATIHVWAGGKKKRLVLTGDDSNVQLYVEAEVCDTCCALVESKVGHNIWHLQQGDGDE